MYAGAEAGAEAAADGIGVFSDGEAWDVLEAIPDDSAAALILLEHHWAVPLQARRATTLDANPRGLEDADPTDSQTSDRGAAPPSPATTYVHPTRKR